MDFGIFFNGHYIFERFIYFFDGTLFEIFSKSPRIRSFEGLKKLNDFSIFFMRFFLGFF